MSNTNNNTEDTNKATISATGTTYKNTLTATGQIPKKQTIVDVKGGDPTAPKKSVLPSKDQLDKAQEDNNAGVAKEIEHDNKRAEETLASRPSKQAAKRKQQAAAPKVVTTKSKAAKGKKK